MGKDAGRRKGEKQSRSRVKKKHRSRARKTVTGRLIGVIFVALIAVLLLFSGRYYVKEIIVSDNARYTDEEIVEMTCSSPLANNTLLFTKTHSRIVLDDVPFMEYVDISMKDNHTIQIRVKEKQLVGVLSVNGTDYYFDNTGTVLETADAKNYGDEKLVPRIVGLDIGRLTYGEQIDIDPKVLNTISALARMIKKYRIHPDYLDYDSENKTVDLVYGNVKVLIGTDTLLEEKMGRTAVILPQLAEDTGILHMENFTEDTVNIVFDEVDWRTAALNEGNEKRGSDGGKDVEIKARVDITEEEITEKTTQEIEENTEELVPSSGEEPEGAEETGEPEETIP